jgi:CHAT domain-containing protein/Tfp pilus assembly protein PilF
MIKKNAYSHVSSAPMQNLLTGKGEKLMLNRRKPITCALFVFSALTFATVPGGWAEQSLRTAMCLSAAAQTLQNTRTLEVSQAVERELAGGQGHDYQLTLNLDQYLEVVVEQRGVDVVVTLDGPDGKRLAQFDADNRVQGQETVTQIAAIAGIHRLVVEAKQKDASPGRYEIRLAALRAATAQDRALEEARRLSDEVGRLTTARKFDEALPLAQRVLTTRERELGQEHPEVASALNRLATLYREKLDGQAEPLYLRAISIAEKTPPPGHPELGAMHNGLGVLYANKADWVRAEVQLQRTIAVWEQTLGPNHPEVGRVLSNLGAMYLRRGDFGKAESALKRSLAIRERGTDQAAIAVTLNNLGNVYFEQQDEGRASPLYERALKVLESLPESAQNPRSLASMVGNLATIYHNQRKFSEAETFYRRALAISEKVLGAESPEVSKTLYNLASLYAARGDYAQAVPVYHRVLAMREKLLGPDHPDFSNTLRGLARAEIAQNNLPPALSAWSRAAAASERNLAYNLTVGSEREKLAYLSTLDRETSQIISLHLRFAADNAEARQLSLTTILRRKGRALDAMSDSIAALRRRAAPEDRTLLDQLKQTRSQLAQLVLQPPPGGRRAADAEKIKTLEAQRESLENEISRRSSEFRAQSQPVTLEAVQPLIPQGAALVEFVAYRPYNEKYTQPSEEYGVSRYAAYVLHREGEARWVELGEKRPIDEAINKLRRALRDRKRRDYRALARAVDRLVMQPVRPLLASSRRVLIAPDGGINLIPFAALVDARNEFLIKRYSFSYLTSGRDLLRLQVKQPGKQSALIIANPDFGEESNNRNGSERILRYRPSSQSEAAKATTSILAEAYFPPLPGTADEASALKALIPDSTLLINQEATEARLKAVSSPELLHIATHGFFLEDESPLEAEGRLLVAKSATSPATLPVSNPLFRSGLALAGANRLKSGPNNEEDGILTALEAAGLDLWGTKLVVLSACQTGLGEVKDGDGVYGLRRALVLAGAETQVMSLWAVSDLATRDLMINYYRRLQRGEGRAEALRQSQLRLLNNLNRQRRPGARNYSHPYYWAGFIQSGEWANLNGQR